MKRVEGVDRMNVIRFSLQNLYRERKKTYVYAVSIVLAVCVLYVFFNLNAIFTSPEFIQSMMSPDTVPAGATELTDILKHSAFLLYVLAMVFVSVMCISYANSYYLLNKKRQLGVLMTSGANVGTLIKFMFVQNFVILGIALPIGLLLGGILTPLFNFMIMQFTELTLPYFVFDLTALGYTLSVCALFAVFLVMTNVGFVYRTEIKDLFFEGEESGQLKVAKIPSWVCLGGYIVCVIYAIVNHEMFGISIMMSLLALYLISIYLKSHSETLITKIMARDLKNRYSHIYLGSLRHALKHCGNLYTIIFMTLLLLFQIIVNTQGDEVNNILAVCCFAVALLLLGGCIVFKLSMEAVTRKEFFKNLNCLGYTVKELKKIISREIFWFYIVMIVFPETCFLTIVYNFTGFMDVTPFILLTAFYPIVLIVYMFLTRVLYIKTVLTVEKGD